jgi:hypothetical protein
LSEWRIVIFVLIVFLLFVLFLALLIELTDESAIGKGIEIEERTVSSTLREIHRTDTHTHTDTQTEQYRQAGKKTHGQTDRQTGRRTGTHTTEGKRTREKIKGSRGTDDRGQRENRIHNTHTYEVQGHRRSEYEERWDEWPSASKSRGK